VQAKNEIVTNPKKNITLQQSRYKVTKIMLQTSCFFGFVYVDNATLGQQQNVRFY
jgi:hypothetical protein